MQIPFVCEMTSDDPTKKFNFDESKPLDGIFAYTTSQCGGNVWGYEMIDVTGSGYYR